MLARWEILPSLPTTRLRRAELVAHALVLLDDLVERVGDLAVDAVEVDREADGEVALLEAEQGGQDLRSARGVRPGRRPSPSAVTAPRIAAIGGWPSSASRTSAAGGAVAACVRVRRGVAVAVVAVSVAVPVAVRGGVA